MTDEFTGEAVDGMDPMPPLDDETYVPDDDEAGEEPPELPGDTPDDDDEPEPSD